MKIKEIGHLGFTCKDLDVSIDFYMNKLCMIHKFNILYGQFLEHLEKQAYLAGGGNYYAPIQLMGDFFEGNVKHMPSRILPTYAGGKRTTVTSIEAILPNFVSQRLKEGFYSFDKKIKGFAVEDAVLT